MYGMAGSRYLLLILIAAEEIRRPGSGSEHLVSSQINHDDALNADDSGQSEVALLGLALYR